jgi:mannan endo-1,4-beta-mannosidase
MFIGCVGTPSNTAAAEKGFVTIKDGSFMLNGEEFRFLGTNNYYMHYSTDMMQRDVIEDAAEMGFKVLRIWGFQMGPNRDHNSYGLNEPAKKGKEGSYGIPEKYQKTSKKSNELGYPRDVFERLDYTIAEAGKHNVKLVIALNNYWAEFGGLQQASTWQRWFNLKNATDFYTNEDCKIAYKDYVRYVLTRVNTYTGIPYNQDPTIMTWELINEPRNPDDKTGKVVTAWAKEMSAYVKSLAPNQLCAVGDEGGFKRDDLVGYADEGNHMYNGFEGTDFDALLALKNIDYGTYHLYPESWGIEPEAVENWGVQYIKDHIDSGKKAKKPVVLEEYGVSNAGGQNRLAVYDRWNKTVYENGGAASMVWILTASNEYELSEGGDGIYDDYDGFRILNDDSPVSTMLRSWAARFSGTETEKTIAVLDTPRAYLLSPSKAQEAKGLYSVRSELAGKTAEVKSVKLYINGELAPVPNTLQYNKTGDLYRINLLTESYDDGTKLGISVLFTFKDGTEVSTEEIPIVISNNVTYTLFKTFDFASGTEDAMSLGGYQAEIKSITHSTLHNGMLQINGSFPGLNEWEELKVKFPLMSDIGQAAKLDFTVYIEKNKVSTPSGKTKPEDKLPGMQNYFAFDPGWVKTGIGTQNCELSNLEVVTLEDGKAYYKQICSFEFFNNPDYTLITICPTMGYVAYDGPIYLDEINLYKKD